MAASLPQTDTIALTLDQHHREGDAGDADEGDDEGGGDDGDDDV